MKDTNRQIVEQLERGLRLQRQGRSEEAIGIYRAVVQHFPAHADALYLYGMSLYETGDGTTARDLLSRAVNAAPDNPAFHCGLGLAQQRVGMDREAIASFKRAVQINPSFVEAYHNLGVAHLLSGQPAVAVTYFERAVELEPKQPAIRFALARTLESLGRLDSAAAAYRDVLAIDPGHVDTLLRLAGLPPLVVPVEESFDLAARAVERAPSHVDALVLYAGQLEMRNRLDEAREVAEKALLIAPGERKVGILLANIDFRTGNLEAARQRLEKITADPDTESANLASANHLLGLILDRFGEYEAAFAATMRSNKLAAGSSIISVIDREYYPRRIEALEKWCATGLSRTQGSPVADGSPSDPIFFVGFPRSGTTLVEQVLAAHPGLYTSGEFTALSDTIAAIPDVTGNARPYPEALDDLTYDDIGTLRAVYWKACADAIGLPDEGQRLVDKLPLNIIDLGFVQKIFPQARILTALRDPRDVCLSCLMQKFALTNAMIHFLSLEDTARFYAKVMGLWQIYDEALTLPSFVYRYEDLITDFSGTVRDIIGFLGLQWDDRVLAYRETAGRNGIATPSYRDVASPVYTRAVGRWAKYSDQIAPVLPVLAPFIEAFGYNEPAGGPRSA